MPDPVVDTAEETPTVVPSPTIESELSRWTRELRERAERRRTQRATVRRPRVRAAQRVSTGETVVAHFASPRVTSTPRPVLTIDAEIFPPTGPATPSPPTMRFVVPDEIFQDLLSHSVFGPSRAPIIPELRREMKRIAIVRDGYVYALETRNEWVYHEIFSIIPTSQQVNNSDSENGEEDASSD